jgi:tetratricopeptide (TPR) repeat protein
MLDFYIAPTNPKAFHRSASMSQKNINYGTITAGGNVHIGDKIYIVERDFPHCILFLRLENGPTGYEAMLSVKGPDDASIPLLSQRVRLPITENLFEQVADFQSLRRGANQAMRDRGLHRPSEQTLEISLPQAIYQSFFVGDIGQVCADFLSLLQSGKIRDLLLVISTDDEAAQNLPWEMVLPLLTTGAGYTLPRDNFGLVRSRETTLASFNRHGPTASAAPMKLLFIPALPENLSERGKMLEIEDEQRKIIEAVGRLEITGNQPRLVMEILDCANLDEITAALRARQHDVVHISGHGAYLEDLKQGILCLEDEDGNEQQVTGKALGEALKAFSSIKLLVLSACETAVGGSDGSTAEQMADVGLPAVLAMRFSVTDAGARIFTETFYERLAYGDSLTKAMHDARLRLWDDVQQRRRAAPQMPAIAEWFTPVLYQNQVIGPLVAPGQYNTETHDRFYPKIDFVKGQHTRLIDGGFIGRKRLRIQLRQCFRQQRAVCLHGLGGLGKTTTAEAFAEHYGRNLVHNIEIFQGKAGIQEYLILRRVFDKWKANTQPKEYMAGQLLSQIESPDMTVADRLNLLIANCLQGQRNILIFDNFEELQTDSDDVQQQIISSDGLRSFLRHLLQNKPKDCQILFTTRYQIDDRELNALVTHLPIGKMTYAEQYRYLNFSDTLRHLLPAERDIVHRRLDGHPRALALLEGEFRKDPRFDLARFSATVGQVEADIFADLLPALLLTQLTKTETTVFLTASVFFSRTPVAALSAVLNTPANDLAPVLTALQNWSLCFWDEAAQTVEVHALTRTWLRTQNLPDPAVFKTISHQTGTHFRDQPDLDNAVLAVEYFEQAESWEDYATLSFRLDDFYQLSGSYLTALNLNEQILSKDISKEINALALSNLGRAISEIGDYERAFTYFQQSLDIAQESSDESQEASVLNSLGTLTYSQGKYSISLNYFKQSLKISKRTKDKQLQGDNLNNMGEIYRIIGRDDYKTAMTHLNDSLIIRQKIGHKRGEGTTLNSIGGIYLSQKKYKIALEYFQRALIIQREASYKKGEGVVLNSIMGVYMAWHNYDKALDYLRQSRIIHEQIGNKSGLAFVLHNTGAIYFKELHQIEKATILLLQAYTLFRELGSPKAESTVSYLNDIRKQIGEARFQQILQSIQNEE